MKFNEMKNAVNKKEIVFKNIKLPVNTIGDGRFIDNEGNVFRVNHEAAITLRNQTGYQVYKDDGSFKRRYNWSYSEVKAMIINGEWDRIKEVINYPLTKQKPFDNIDVVLVNNLIVGVYKNYNMVTHDLIVKSIDSAYLGNRVRDFVLNNSDFHVYLTLKDNFDLHIFNGLNSDKSFGYKLYCDFNGLQVNIDLNKNSNKKHLSNVGVALESLADVFDQLGELNFDFTVNNTNAKSIHNHLLHLLSNTNDDKLQTLYETLDKWLNNQYISMSASDYFKRIGKLTQEHGLKLVSKKYGEILLQALFDGEIK